MNHGIYFDNTTCSTSIHLVSFAHTVQTFLRYYFLGERPFIIFTDTRQGVWASEIRTPRRASLSVVPAGTDGVLHLLPRLCWRSEVSSTRRLPRTRRLRLVDHHNYSGSPPSIGRGRRPAKFPNRASTPINPMSSIIRCPCRIKHSVFIPDVLGKVATLLDDHLRCCRALPSRGIPGDASRA